MSLRRAQPWLGTLVDITVHDTPTAHAHQAIDAAFARIAQIHRALSFQSPDSELTRVNLQAVRQKIRISADFRRVLRASLDLAADSQGLFDPSTAACLLRAGQLPRHPGLPASPRAGLWSAIGLDEDTVEFAEPLVIDLSGIAKGYAVDAGLAVLRDMGVPGALINAGGDLARYGERQDTVHVRDPRHPTATLPLASLSEGALASSAAYFQTDGHGKTRSALYHPENGAQMCLKESVSVLAPTCMLADAMTKILAASPDAALPILAKHHCRGLILSPAEDGLDLAQSAASRWQTQRLARAPA
jgi:thiamine biosynthesis lipoprotein